MIIALIFMVAFAALAGYGIYQAVTFIKSPVVTKQFRPFIIKQLIFIGAAAIAFLVMSFGFYMWLEANPTPLYVVQLVVGGLLFPSVLLIAINSFIIHYYNKQTPQELDKWLYRIIFIGFASALVFFFIWTNGLAPYLTYPLINGFSFTDGFVTPNGQARPNIAFYALCILTGAILVYFLCDHYMYKEYGEHGILESTFIVAFPAGIIGARIWYVIGNWSVEFVGRPWYTMFQVWEGGLTILGGAVTGIVVGVLFFLWRNKGKSIFLGIDIIVPTILIAQAVGRLGNFFNCEVHGLPSDLIYWKWLPEVIWRNAAYSSTSGFADSGQIYVPLFLIEGVANIAGYFIISMLFGRLLRKYTELGDLGAGYIIWYGLTRVLMEPLRSADFQMGTNGYWSWIWSLSSVVIGVLLIVANHVIRYLIAKKNNTYKAIPNAKKTYLMSTAIIGGVGAILLAVGIYLITSNNFVAKVAYNNYNVGVILLIVGLSLIALISISILKLVEVIKTEKHVKYKLLLFDLDGTLCNTDEMVVQTFFKLYENYTPKVKRTREEIYYFSGPPLKKTMAEEFPNYRVEELCDAFVKTSKIYYDLTVTPYEDEIATLKALKQAGYKLGIVTNKSSAMLNYSLDLCKIKQFFDVIVPADAVATPKPSKDGIIKAMQQLNIRKSSEVLYIGDNDIDYETATNAGVDCMLVTWGPRTINFVNLAKYQAKSYKELGELLLCEHSKL